jgi:alkaline phosphatase D
MRWSRRQALLGLAGGAAQAALMAVLPKRAWSALRSAPHGAYAILQGATSSHATQLSIVVRKEEKLTAHLMQWPVGAPAFPVMSERVERSDSEWAVWKLKFELLIPGLRYVLQIRSESGHLLDERILSTAATYRPSARVAVVSCITDKHLEDQHAAFGELLAQKPDLILMLGDNVYCDHGPEIEGEAIETRIWRRYAEQVNAFLSYRVRELTPTLAIWDDHDFGMNNANGKVPWLASTTETFRAFWAQDAMGGYLEAGPGIASYVEAYGQCFLLMDGRTWRSDTGGPELDQSHWGEEQTQWALEKIRDASGPVWLVNGNQFFGGYLPGESFERSHPVPFYRFLAELRALPPGTAPVFFVSGDRHFTELMEIRPDDVGYTTYEVTSSGLLMDRPNGTWWLYKNPRHIAGEDDKRNFVVIDARADGKELKMDLRGRGIYGEEFYRRHLTIRGAR